MLILSRKSGESIVIDGRIKVTIIRLEGEAVKVGIEAPPQVPVHRQEVYEEIQRSNQQAITRQSVPLPRLAEPGSGKKQPGSNGSASRRAPAIAATTHRVKQKL